MKAEFTRALAITTSQCVFKTASTSKLLAHQITPQHNKPLGAKLLARRHKRAQEEGGWVTWVFATEDISKVEEKFGRSAIEGHRTRPDGSDLKWKQIGVNQITESRELPFFI